MADIRLTKILWVDYTGIINHGEAVMLIYGYRGTIDWNKVRAAFKKCTSMTATDIDKAVKQIKSGSSTQIEDDFVLHDELKDLGILVK